MLMQEELRLEGATQRGIAGIVTVRQRSWGMELILGPYLSQSDKIRREDRRL
jgi:hypothetical protein